MARNPNVVPFRKPFKAVPLRRVVNRPRRSPARRRWPHWSILVLVVLPMAASMAVYQWSGWLDGLALSLRAPKPTPIDREAAYFTLCGTGPSNGACVIDGDTIVYHGEHVRLLGINAAETVSPACEFEAELGLKATDRLRDWLNAGPFSLLKDPFGRDRDQYGRLLRTIKREGHDVGDTLVKEGLADYWRGKRNRWCG
jgi:endonuclease YncB( thermonuclease family)